MLKQLLSNLRSSFWFVPSLIVLASIVLAVVLVEADSVAGDLWLSQWPHLFGAGAEGARDMLSTLAGAMMSVTGVTFSMTLVALALASSQYTSRILRNFMRSRVTQTTLGTFAGIFAFCLVVLRTIRSGDAEFVPSLAVFVAFLLAIGGIGVLVYFIHHIASSIQASSIVASIAEETIESIDRLFPESPGRRLAEDEDECDAVRIPPERAWHAVRVQSNGYIQSVDSAALLRLANDRDMIVRMEHAMGAFMVQDTVLVSLALKEPPDQTLIDDLNSAFSIGRNRTVEQDPAFGIRQLVDIAMKSLSSGINDSSTGIMCVDYLLAIVARLAVREFPASRHYEGGKLRMIVMAPTFEDLLAESLDQIRGSAGGNVAVMVRILGAIQRLASLTAIPGRRQALRNQVQFIAELADRTVAARHDRERIEKRLMLVREALRLEIEPHTGAAKA